MILGLHGKMRSGKNTVAERLKLYSPLPVVEVSFAAKLKQSAAALLDVPVTSLETAKNDPYARVALVYLEPGGSNDILASQTVREFLQRYGTESHRDVFGADFWLDAALPLKFGTVGPERGHFPDPYGDALYVVTDVRFPNEAQRVRDLGGVMVKVVGPETDTGSHASEQELDCDYTLDNTVRDDGFADLDGRVCVLLSDVGVGFVNERRAA